ncbi:zinc finger CCCH domain-containing protein 68-like [Lotus japonicus]|uniref:zinc finger CCCH domain-containing protein 68-like n=1 Tax=Lotus japonicus TaxID=34305 RepID=UPI00258D15D6|nr:zinc finger CCCH domain-containing protein 68-like [Lotus japonicus]
MERPRKSKGVSLDKRSKECQVKYFSSDDSPSQIGWKSQGGNHHLQAMPTSILDYSTNESNDSYLPPGFESGPFLDQTMVKWECPPQFAISPHWFVRAGEASEEKDTEKLRELRVIEAHYPRPSSIPPSPLVSSDVEEEDYDDTATPIVSLIPIEETEDYDDDNASSDIVPLIPIDVQEEVAMDISPERTVLNAPSDMHSQKLQRQHLSATTTPLSSGCNPSSSTVSLDDGGVTDLSRVSAQDLATVAALIEAILKINQRGSSIDVDLLIKIFNNPQMVERLSTENRIPPPNLRTDSSSNNPLSISTFGLNPTFPSIPLMPLSTSPPCGVAAYSGTTPLTGVASLLPSPVVMPSAPSFTILNPAPNNLTAQIPAAISSYSMANFMHDSYQTTTDASTPLSWPVCAPNTADPQMQLSWPAYTPFKPATVVSENIHKSNGVPTTVSLNIPPQQDIVQASSLSSGIKRAASFSISSNGQSSVQFSSTTEKYLNTFGTQTTARTTTKLHASQSNTSSSGSAAARDDGDYYKNLVRRRDEARQVKQDSRSSFRESKSAAQDIRHQEPERHRSEKAACIYYNSPRGCRNGAQCRFRHHVSSRRDADNNVRGSSYLKKLRL